MKISAWSIIPIVGLMLGILNSIVQFHQDNNDAGWAWVAACLWCAAYLFRTISDE